MYSENFTEFDKLVSQKNNIRICILDNNNVQFCMHHKRHFPIDKIYEYYDVILIPGWVHEEIAQSDHRIRYISSIPSTLFFMDEIKDYLPLIEYNDLKLMKVFCSASSPGSEPHRYLKKQIRLVETLQHEIADNWIEEYYNKGFNTTQHNQLKKNAGENSILTLAFLLVHYYGSKIKQISISSGDRGVVDIKNKIMDYISKHELLNVPFINPISFLSTDVLLAQAFKLGTINEEELYELRKSTQRKKVICTITNEDGTATPVETEMDTEDFITVLKGDNPFSIVF